MAKLSKANQLSVSHWYFKRQSGTLPKVPWYRRTQKSVMLNYRISIVYFSHNLKINKWSYKKMIFSYSNKLLPISLVLDKNFDGKADYESIHTDGLPYIVFGWFWNELVWASGPSPHLSCSGYSFLMIETCYRIYCTFICSRRSEHGFGIAERSGTNTHK